MKRNRPASKQTLRVLAVLLSRPSRWYHGYELSKETQLKSGTLYPILMRLCDRDFLEAKWENKIRSNRPPRHLYRLTQSGKNFAKEQLRKTVSLNKSRVLTEVHP